MDQTRLREFEARCIQEEPPACQTACPLHVDARGLARLLAEGKENEARKLLDRLMPLSGLLGLLCEGPCMGPCRRSEIDAGVNLPLLERWCVGAAKAAKPMALPATGKNIAVVGAGLSGLVAAWELGKKGHAVTVFHHRPPGGRLRALPAGQLPPEALEDALERLAVVRVVFEAVDQAAFAGLGQGTSERLAAFEAVYLGLDDMPGVPAPATDDLTLQTADPRVFAGGKPLADGPRCIREAADGRRAAGSVDRLLQGVAPASARAGEGPYASKLYTDISEAEPKPAVFPADPWAPTAEEAKAEAERCLRCECLECVKRCAYLAHYKGHPKRYGREIYNNLAVIHGLRLANTMTNSCAQCGLCAAVCPHDADMGAFCAEARQEMVGVRHMPPSAHEFALEDMTRSNSDDTAFCRHAPGTSASARLFFPGCRLPASLPAQTRAVYEHLCRQLPDGVGFALGCCGAPARWAGREAVAKHTARRFREQWQAADKPEVILACASCSAFFAAELPEIPRRSLWEVLAELPLPPGAEAAPFTPALHDPCAARDHAEMRAAARRLLRALGQNIEELPLGRELTRCCGYGGLAAAANPLVGEKFALDRAGDTKFPLAAYCIMCRDRLRAVGKPALHLLDLLFPCGHTAEDALERPAPGISTLQENLRDFRAALLRDLWGEEPPKDPGLDEITLEIPEDVARRMEERRILRSDVSAVLRAAKEKGPAFRNPATGRSRACLRPRRVTFWVEYEELPDGPLRIHDAYCHRMIVPGLPGEGAPALWESACGPECAADEKPAGVAYTRPGRH